MCGIAGWFSPQPIAHEQMEHLRAMVSALAHRGPDGEGHHLEAHAALGHRRLSIIDIEGGVQPMRAGNAPVYITFNGEIYNYRALREKLKSEGCVFHSQSDTEVILHLYMTHGTAAFNQLRGMYAFGIWDARRATGILARDPIGIKPLFVQESRSGDLAFGSEAKAILARSADHGVLDESALHLLMNFRYLPGQRSLFKGIRQLAPGHVLEWKASGGCNEYPMPALSAPATAEIDLLESLQDSVLTHLTADVEVGAYLSGGIDSATIVALAKQAGYRGLRTFTLDVGDDPLEAVNAAETGRLLAVENFRGHIDRRLDAKLKALIWNLELPKINALQVSELAQYAAQFGKVVLSGVGGDEVFLGYNAHRILHLANAAHDHVPEFLRRWVGSLSLSLNRTFAPPVIWSERERASLMFRDLGNWPRVYGLLRNVWDDDNLRRTVYGPRMLDADLPNAFDVLEAAWPHGPDPVTSMAEYEWREKMVNDLLWQEDRCSMAAGLEVRVPFLDVPFAAAARSLDRARLMPNGKPKAYMKQMIKPLLPTAVLNRKKSGFQVDAPRFFAEHLAELAGEILSEERIRHFGLFNPAFVRDVMRQRPQKNLRWHYFVLYLMLTTHIWMDHFEQPA